MPKDTHRPEDREEARRLMDAIDSERERQGIPATHMSGNTDYCRIVYTEARKRGTANMVTFAAFCRQLDIEIILVNKEGDAIT